MRQEFINQIYQLLDATAQSAFNNGYSFLANPVPDRFINQGLYFFLDPAIPRPNGGIKIVRIGITRDNQNNRLNLHKTGHTVSSIFRRHVGRALTQLNNNNPALEIDISNYIYALPYLFLPIANVQDLCTLEKRCIEIISNKRQNITIDPPNENWLGWQHGPGINNAISQSHLWCVHHTGTYSATRPDIYNDALMLLENYVTAL